MTKLRFFDIIIFTTLDGARLKGLSAVFGYRQLVIMNMIMNSIISSLLLLI